MAASAATPPLARKYPNKKVPAKTNKISIDFWKTDISLFEEVDIILK
jgi:hypothetical protein